MITLDQEFWRKRPKAQDIVQSVLAKARNEKEEKEKQETQRQAKLGYCDNVWLSEDAKTIKTELTLEDNPLFVVNCFRSPSRQYQRQIKTSKGEAFIQRVQIGQRKDSPRTFGVLKEKHQEALYRLIDLWQRSGCKLTLLGGRPRAVLVTTAYQLAKSFCGSDSSPSYKYTRSVIEDLEAIPISIENAFTRKGISRVEFTILNVEWREGSGAKKGSSQIVILFSSVITEGFMHGHVKPFSLQTYLKLDNSRKHKCSAAKLLHRILDRELATKQRYNIALNPLLERLGIRAYKHKSQRKQKIMPAAVSLENSLILADTHRVSLELKLSKDGRDYILIAAKRPKELNDEALSEMEPSLPTIADGSSQAL